MLRNHSQKTLQPLHLQPLRGQIPNRGEKKTTLTPGHQQFQAIIVYTQLPPLTSQSLTERNATEDTLLAFVMMVPLLDAV